MRYLKKSSTLYVYLELLYCMKKRTSLLFFFCCWCMGIFAQGLSTISPADNYYSPRFNVTFSWNTLLNVSSYRIKIASDSAFTNILKDTVVNQTSATLSFDKSTSFIFWKVSTANTPVYAVSVMAKLRFINPSQDPNLLVWLSADSNTVLQPDSTVNTWNNIIPNSLNAVQTTDGLRPRLMNKIPELNNERALRFDGVDDYLLINSGGQLGNAYMVANWRGGGTLFPSYNALLTRQETTPSFAIIFGFIPNSSILYPGYYGSNTFINNSSSNSFSPLDKYKVISGNRTGSPIIFPNFTVGKDLGGANRVWNGDISELIMSTSSSTTESDSIHTYLFNKYAPPVNLGPDIVAGASFSDSVTLDAGVRFTSFLWSSGAVTQTQKVATAGTYSVKVKDIFGRESTDDIQVYPYRRMNNANVYLCSGDSLVLNLGISNPQFFFSWSTGSSANSITIKTSGQYTVRIIDSKGQEVRDTINVFIGSPVLSPPVPPSNTINLCFNEKLFVTSPSAFDSIHWSTGSNAPFLQFSTPGTYSIYARTVNGCTLNKTFTVNISGFAPTADFSTSSICQNAATQFSDRSTAPAGNTINSWKWSFGDGNISNAQDPSNIYTANGNVTVSLKITSNVGCTDSIARTITVNKRPLANFSNRLSCSGNPTQFVDESIANADSLVNWNWDFAGLGQSNSIRNPSFNFPSAATYNVQLIATNSNGCVDSVIKPVVVNPSPIANFSFDSVCGTSAVNFKWLSTVTAPATINVWRWDFGDGTFNSAQREPQHNYSGPGTYDVSLTVYSTDQCVDTVEKQVKVFDYPVVDFVVSQTQCTGREIQFTDISTSNDATPVTSWRWFFAGQATSSQQNPRYTFNTQGNYVIQLTASNSVGCSGTKQRSIAVSDPPTPKFSFSPQYGQPPLNVSYTNQSSVNGNYIWDYGDGSPAVAAYNPPNHTYSTRGSYPISLIATDFRGCTDTLTKFILVDRAYLDAVMASINLIPDGNFYKVVVTVLNNSNIELRSMGLSLQLGSGSVVRENWTGSLLPGKSFSYTFTGEIRTGDNQIPVVCATIDNINDNAPEDRTDNNSLCKEVKVGQFDVLSVYPNPAYENINFGVMLPQDGTVSIGFVDELGQIMYKKDFSGTKGYNAFNMTTMPLNAAVYIAVVSYNGDIIRVKFMRTDRAR